MDQPAHTLTNLPRDLAAFSALGVPRFRIRQLLREMGMDTEVINATVDKSPEELVKITLEELIRWDASHGGAPAAVEAAVEAPPAEAPKRSPRNGKGAAQLQLVPSQQEAQPAGMVQQMDLSPLMDRIDILEKLLERATANVHALDKKLEESVLANKIGVTLSLMLAEQVLKDSATNILQGAFEGSDVITKLLGKASGGGR
jgi:hypothetical protein